MGTQGAEDSGGPGAERREAPPASGHPCLFVTTASKDDEKPLLPGPRKKQAEALTQNILWMADTFGKERIGFLTLTLGDFEAGGRYRNLRDRKEAQRRFHSLMTNEIAKRYVCGVTVTERHKNRGLHLHLAVVCKKDIYGQIDFAACFPPKGWDGTLHKPNYSTANDALKREWAYWRKTAKLYGFGRHQLQPMRTNGEALGRYVGAYLQKDWDNRLPEDKGARCVRYFGHWSKEPRQEGKRAKTTPHKSQFGWMTPRACAWREMVKQAVTVLNYKGAKITEENIKDILGRRWAWKMGKLFQAVWQGEKGGLMNSECKNQNNGDSLLSYKQAAAMLNVCVRTLRRMVDVGQLVAVRIRGRVLFHLSDILKIQREGIS
jgi:excisionase family DNA binding protein